jgi:hypothetical protein
MIDVRTLGGRDAPTVRVTTVDATNYWRSYEIQLGPSEVDGASVLQGKRVAPETEPDVPSNVFDAARNYFEEQGQEVFGR